MESIDFRDVTCRALTDEVIALASVAPMARIMRTSELLATCCDADRQFSEWATYTEALLTGADCLPKPSRLATLAGQLPECVAKIPLTADTGQSQRTLVSAAHLSARMRATECSFSEELETRQQNALYNFAYGLSHELNNPLANISTRASTLAQTENDVHRRSLLESIVENAMRGCEMLGDLMLIARPPQLKMEPIEIASFLSEIGEQASRWSARTQIDLEIECQHTATMEGDRAALREAIWAVVRNAIEALVQPGCVRIQAEANSDTLEIAILDNGPGLSPEALRHCFDVFYSGREAGRGLGIGLAKSRRIIELHDGRISLHNAASEGCLVTIWLPICNRHVCPDI